MITVDGNFGEGGGSIVRVALALSTITQTPFEISNIRKGRDKPGLKNQHLYCIKALETLCNAKAERAELSSLDIKYAPSKIKGQTIDIDIGTAGSISLLLQSLLIPSTFASSLVKFNITGGTDGKWAMPLDYFANVLSPHLQKYANIQTSMKKRGYYPKGGGNVEIKIRPKYSLNKLKELPKIDLTEQGHLIQIKGTSHASTDLQKSNVAERQARSAKLSLNKLNCHIDIQAQYSETLSTGSGIVLWAIFSKDPDEISTVNPIRIGADSLGEKGKKAEQVGQEAAENLLKEIESKAPVDQYLADNLIPFIALIGGKMKVSKITDHTLTNIYVCEQFLGKVIEVDKENNMIKSTF